MVGLVAATVVTLPGAIGAGGALYYYLRHQHRICPRCGTGWGKRSERALPTRLEPTARPAVVDEVGGRGEGVMRVWSVMLFILGAIFLGIGAVELEAVLLVLGVVSTGSALLLRRSANVAREKRREGLLTSLQMHVLQLAGQRRGRLTVTEVAAALSWPMRRAERVLHSLDDGWRVNSEVTDEGVIVYEFREIIAHPTSNPRIGEGN